MKTLLAFIVWFGIISTVALATTGHVYQTQSVTLPAHDPRIGVLTRFMSRHHFAKPYYVQDYIKAADENQLEWRILPGIAVLESSGCVHLSQNNCFGWDSAHTGFRSIRIGIHFVARQLASGSHYQGKPLERKIRTYNSINPAYWSNFQKLMKELQ